MEVGQGQNWGCSAQENEISFALMNIREYLKPAAHTIVNLDSDNELSSFGVKLCLKIETCTITAIHTQHI
jgi:hypothetical protein